MHNSRSFLVALVLLPLWLAGCDRAPALSGTAASAPSTPAAPAPAPASASRTPSSQAAASRPVKLVQAARSRVHTGEKYDPAYFRIAYPGGDVPSGRGVCTDVVIRAYRAQQVDLQQLVHEDMRQHFSAYPRRWGLKAPDPHIDHRRVPNLQTFFTRQGSSLPASTSPADYQPGDLVTWMLPGNLPHIGIVSDRRTQDRQRPLIIHNIGAGSTEEDALFAYPVTGHYRFFPGPG